MIGEGDRGAGMALEVRGRGCGRGHWCGIRRLCVWAGVCLFAFPFPFLDLELEGERAGDGMGLLDGWGFPRDGLVQAGLEWEWELGLGGLLGPMRGESWGWRGR